MHVVERPVELDLDVDGGSEVRKTIAVGGRSCEGMTNVVKLQPEIWV